MKRLIVPFVALALALMLTGCGELLDPAAAVVNGQKITVDEITADLERFEASPEFERLAQQGDAQALKRQVEQQILSQEIRRAVLQPKAEGFGIEVTDEDVAERMDQIKQDFPTEGAFEEALKEQGLTLDQLTELVRDNLLEERLREKVTEETGPTEEELTAYYESNEADFTETAARHILVDDKALASRIAKQLQAAKDEAALERVFEKLAKKHSTDQSNAAQGGDLGYFKPGDFVPEFERAADELEIGEVSGPVKTEFGFHVILVTDRRVAPFEDVRAEIEQELGQGAADEAWDEYVRKAYEEADVKVNPKYGEFDEESLAVVDPTAQDVPGAEEGSDGTTPTDPNQSPPPAE